ncbi:MAG: NAD(P)H-dependent oxidoreductase subunit E [Acidimicrobiales bacterium]
MPEIALTSAAPTDAEVAAVADSVVLQSPGLITFDAIGPAVTFDGDRIARSGQDRIFERRHLLLPVLHAVRDAVGWISEGGANEIARVLQVPPAEVFGVASFYELFTFTEPEASDVVHVCDDTACRIRNANELIDELRADGAVVHGSPCLGLCEQAPAVFVQRTGQQHVSVRTATRAKVHEALAGAMPLPIAPVPQDPSELTLLRRVHDASVGDIDGYLATGGYAALTAAVAMSPADVISHVSDSGLTGRGGAAFPTGFKWSAVAAEAGPRHLVVNADESEPGTFKDRVIMEHDPFSLIESMTIGGYAMGAEQGWIYIRGEYPEATRSLRSAIAEARSRNMLGDDVGGHGFRFDIEMRSGAGAYICGEETALLNSIEGYRGEPRNKPPFPTTNGLFGQPTAINNVETMVNVNQIMLLGGEDFAAQGSGRSTGTKLFCLSGHVNRPGVYEVTYGATLREVIDLAEGVDGDLRAILMGGAAGSFITGDMLDVPLTIEASREAGFALGSGVVMALNDTVDFDDFVARIAKFFRDESCGQCVPCRVGTVRQSESLLRIRTKPDSLEQERAMLDDFAQVMADASICGLGHTASGAILSAIDLGLIGGAS